MTDLCAENGLKAVNEYTKSEDNVENLTSKKCEGGYDHYMSYLENIMTKCPNFSIEIKERYYEKMKDKALYCSKDSVTGIDCSNIISDEDFLKPYSQWEPSKCNSSCVAEMDKIIRETLETFKSNTCPEGSICKVFRNTNNQLSSCGNRDFVEDNFVIDNNKGNSTTGTVVPLINNDKENITSDANTLTGQVALFSLIICIIFAFFK